MANIIFTYKGKEISRSELDKLIRASVCCNSNYKKFAFTNYINTMYQIPKELCLYITSLSLKDSNRIKTVRSLLTVSKYFLEITTEIIPMIFNCDTRYDSLLRYFTKLTTLKLRYNKLITDSALSNLTLLTNLDLYDNNLITDSGLSKLPLLTNLKLSFNDLITDSALSKLTLLTNIQR